MLFRSIACAFEDAVIDILIKKSERALRETACDQLVIAGGVSANTKLREQMKSLEKQAKKIFFPRRELCTDNAAMVACNGLIRFLRGERDALDVDARARWPLSEV